MHLFQLPEKSGVNAAGDQQEKLWKCMHTETQTSVSADNVGNLARIKSWTQEEIQTCC